MTEERKQAFEAECRAVLAKYSYDDFCAYGREELKLEKPTALVKEEVENQIISVLCGDLIPNRNRRGKPPKNKYYNPELKRELDEVVAKYAKETENVTESAEEDEEDFEMPAFVDEHGNPLPSAKEYMDEFVRNKKRRQSFLRFSDTEGEGVNDDYSLENPVYTGQFWVLDDVACVLPLNGDKDGVCYPVPQEVIKRYDLRVGDVITYHLLKQNGVEFVSQVLSRNGDADTKAARNRFEACEATHPQEQIFLSNGEHKATLLKYIDYLLPIRGGQRAYIAGEPKTGKSTALLQIAKSLQSGRQVYPFVLLIDQSPETVSEFRKAIQADSLAYTTYEDEPEKQLFIAEFLLARVKRYAECGQNVVLLVDSFNALARAYNDTDESLGGRTLPCGLESKTLQYLKKYLGAARCLEEGGSITVIGTLSRATGNPADDLIENELAQIANHKLLLSDGLARRRVYPSVDVIASEITSPAIDGIPDEELKEFVRRSYLPEQGESALFALIDGAENAQAFKTALLPQEDAEKE